MPPDRSLPLKASLGVGGGFGTGDQRGRKQHGGCFVFFFLYSPSGGMCMFSPFTMCTTGCDTRGGGGVKERHPPAGQFYALFTSFQTLQSSLMFRLKSKTLSSARPSLRMKEPKGGFACLLHLFISHLMGINHSLKAHCVIFNGIQW